MENTTKKILIVEDDDKVRESLTSAFKLENISVFEAQTGREAVEIAFRERPNLILLDIILPGMHGIEVINKLKEDRWGKEVPIMILTNFPEYPGLPDHIKEMNYEIIGKANSSLQELVEKAKKRLGL